MAKNDVYKAAAAVLDIKEEKEKGSGLAIKHSC